MLRALLVACCFAAPASAQFGLPPSRALLLQTLLGSVDWRQRAEAARLLGLTADPRVLESLATSAAHDTMPEVRRAARLSIRQIQAVTAPVPPVVDPNVTLVDVWYQRYLSRSPDPAGLNSCVDQLGRGAVAEDVLAQMILGSDEFWLRSGSQVYGFVTRLYQTILGRTPNPVERAQWADVYLRNRGDRVRTARQFIAAAQRELLDRRLNPFAPW